MAQADAIFQLIKSLSPAEKAAVRQIDQKDAGYLALFDLIAKSQAYEESKLKKRLAALGHDLNFAYAKNYLTKHILRCIRDGRKGSSVERMYEEIQVLMERKVFSLAEKMLAKAKAAAYEEERWPVYLGLTQIELQLEMLQGGGVEESISRITAINAQRKDARDKMANLGAFEDLYALYRPVVKRKQLARNEWDLALLKDLQDHPLMNDPQAASSVRAQFSQLQSKIMLSMYGGRFDDALSQLEARVKLSEIHGFLRDDHPSDYLNDLLRIGGIKLHKRDFVAVDQILERIQMFEHGSVVINAEIFEKYHQLLIGVAMESKNPSRIMPVYAELVKGMEAYRDSMSKPSLMTLLVTSARLQLELGNYSESRKLLEGVLDISEVGVREDLTSLARILLVLIYAEKGDHELAESASKATRKYLRRKDALFQFEKRLLSYFEKLVDAGPSGSGREELQHLRTDLVEIFRNPLEGHIQSIFDFIGWIDAKLK